MNLLILALEYFISAAHSGIHFVEETVEIPSGMIDKKVHMPPTTSECILYYSELAYNDLEDTHHKYGNYNCRIARHDFYRSLYTLYY